MSSKLDKIEKYHRNQLNLSLPKVTGQELLGTLMTSLFMTPFLLTLFFVLPMMGQVTVLFAAIVTISYLYVRRSLTVLIAGALGSLIVGVMTFITIQALKDRLDIPLFIWLVAGIPITIIYCIFLGMRIWSLKNPVG